jgi:ubiquinone/menaquinone biosynthesis C-methylase UbiE
MRQDKVSQLKQESAHHRRVTHHVFARDMLLASPYHRLITRAGEDVFSRIAELIALPENAWLLDVDSGPGYLDTVLARRYPTAYITGVDESASNIRFAKRLRLARLAKNCSFTSGNPARIPFGEASFDVVLSASSASYWPDGRRVLSEMRRVLVRDGMAKSTSITPKMSSRIWRPR